MLILKSIVKEYTVEDATIKALNGINIDFREKEFVSILGSSGCGKTTLLNIMGGLDRYTSGDFSIKGKFTEEFSERDWDTYRNHSTGFVFQSYHLIPHQTVLANVELALTIAGVSPSVRREKAIATLKKVGLGDQLHKNPSQLSCGQMQRVAIARAVVNDPAILLADEPAGALDAETSVQIMEILNEMANDKLIIMATNNPELAMRYSTRIIKLLDGHVIDDSNPYHVVVEKPCHQKNGNKKQKKPASMGSLAALSLSVNSLTANKARTCLTALAGSIGITGIALIWALSSGVQTHILRLEQTTADVNSLRSAMMVISCILIALAAISLAASSLMIYMSVGERTKEIGILRSIGASRKDIARVFSAATLMVGFAAGAIGIGVSWLLTVPLNAMIKAGTGISGMAALSVVEAILLVLISMGLHCIAGLIASGIAVKQDPVAALISK